MGNNGRPSWLRLRPPFTDNKIIIFHFLIWAHGGLWPGRRPPDDVGKKRKWKWKKRSCKERQEREESVPRPPELGCGTQDPKELEVNHKVKTADRRY